MPTINTSTTTTNNSQHSRTEENSSANHSTTSSIQSSQHPTQSSSGAHILSPTPVSNNSNAFYHPRYIRVCIFKYLAFTTF